MKCHYMFVSIYKCIFRCVVSKKAVSYIVNINKYSAAEGYIQQADDVAAGLQTETICFNIRSFKQTTDKPTVTLRLQITDENMEIDSRKQQF